MNIADLIEFLNASFEEESKRLYRALESATDAAAKNPCDTKVTDRARVAIDVHQNMQVLGFALEKARKASENGDDANSVLNALLTKLVDHQNGVSRDAEAHMTYGSHLGVLISEIERKVQKED